MQSYLSAPITEDGSKEGRLVGILTNRSAVRDQHRAPVSEVMTKERLITVPVGTTLDQARDSDHKVEKAPRRRQGLQARA